LNCSLLKLSMMLVLFWSVISMKTSWNGNVIVILGCNWASLLKSNQNIVAG
jgi:hypothetical protein